MVLEEHQLNSSNNSNGRSSKGKKGKKKIPQRGLGVVQLEKLRIEELKVDQGKQIDPKRRSTSELDQGKQIETSEAYSNSSSDGWRFDPLQRSQYHIQSNLVLPRLNIQMEHPTRFETRNIGFREEASSSNCHISKRLRENNNNHADGGFLTLGSSLPRSMPFYNFLMPANMREPDLKVGSGEALNGVDTDLKLG